MVLLIEDSADMQELIKSVFEKIDSELMIVSSLNDARSFIQAHALNLPKLILLDINLPDGNGIEFVGELMSDKSMDHIPFLFISSKEDITTKMAAFSLGAEDYIVKPFELLELRARLISRIKKIDTIQEKKNFLRRGNIYIDLATRRVWKDDGVQKNEISLTTREFNIFYFLASNEDMVVSRNQILDAVWGNNESVFDRTIDTHISAIRKKLGDLSFYIESVTGYGYRFSSIKSAKSKAA